MKDYKSKNDCKCKIEYCTNKAHAKKLCSKHYSIWRRCGDFGGCYRVIVDGRSYVGKSATAINMRMRDEKSALKCNRMNGAVSQPLLDWFNYICIERLGKDNYTNPKLREKILNDDSIVQYVMIHKLEEWSYTDGSEWESEDEKKDIISDFHIRYKDGKLEQHEKQIHEKYLKAIDNIERREIHKLREEDERNGTNILINVKS